MDNILALDIGEKRIGVARGNSLARLPQPLCILPNDENFLDALRGILDEEQVKTLVIGLPRNMEGQETLQSQYVRQFVKDKLSGLRLPIIFQDETLSTVKAKDKKNDLSRVDAHAAAIILNDYFNETSNEI